MAEATAPCDSVDDSVSVDDIVTRLSLEIISNRKGGTEFHRIWGWCYWKQLVALYGGNKFVAEEIIRGSPGWLFHNGRWYYLVVVECF
jgi:hypothetical protein